jgi:hypothetical protein
MDIITSGSAPWDMDFKGHWEMDRDLISEFIQQQHHNNFHHHHQHHQQSISHDGKDQNFKIINKDDEDDVMLMKCLPTKLIDETLIDDETYNNLMRIKKPLNNREALSISSLKSKFDENVKALWSDAGDGCNDLMKPLTHKYFDDGSASLSLVSSFSSEKNSLSLFNFNEHQQQQQQNLQNPQTHHFEVNAPPSSMCTENYQQQQNYPFNKCNTIDFDCNNNATMVNHGGRGTNNFTRNAFSPRQSDFIKSGTNLQASIWSDTGDFPSDVESLILKEASFIIIYFIIILIHSHK